MNASQDAYSLARCIRIQYQQIRSIYHSLSLLWDTTELHFDIPQTNFSICSQQHTTMVVLWPD